MPMKKFRIFLMTAAIILLGAGVVMVFESASASTFPGVYSYQTSTPNADGQIIYTVEEGDNCTRIYMLTGVSIEQLIALNGLDEDCSITPSQQLILGTVAPATATPEGPTPIPTQGPPTPTPFEGNGMVCVVLYDDQNGNMMRDETELYLEGGVVSINNREGTFSETTETVGGSPDDYEEIEDLACFMEVPEGEYNVTMGIPEGYNPTTSMNYSLVVSAGDTIVIDFGTQPSSQIVDDAADDGEGRSPLLLIVGLFLLAGGAGLAFFFIRSR